MRFRSASPDGPLEDVYLEFADLDDRCERHRAAVRAPQDCDYSRQQLLRRKRNGQDVVHAASNAASLFLRSPRRVRPMTGTRLCASVLRLASAMTCGPSRSMSRI